MVIYRFAENEIDRLSAMADELVKSRVAVIAAANSPSALAAKAATPAIPIVFITPEDPVRLGLVTSLARPGGNLSGINLLSGELAAKRLELLRDLVPGAVRVAVLVNEANASATETAMNNEASAAAIPTAADISPIGSKRNPQHPPKHPMRAPFGLLPNRKNLLPQRSDPPRNWREFIKRHRGSVRVIQIVRDQFLRLLEIVCPRHFFLQAAHLKSGPIPLLLLGLGQSASRIRFSDP
jgi:ABC transporter substrate binding protein